MNDVLVSVVIPAYNSGRFIKETVESVFAQTYTNLEILLVDDGSTDDLRDRAALLCAQDSRLRYIYQDNRGVSDARNSGFEKCRGEYVAFLDADDVWLSGNISAKIEKLRMGEFGLVHSDASVIDDNSRPTGKVIVGREGYVLDKLLAWEGTSIPGPSSILVPRSVIERVGGFDTNLSTSADQDFFFRVASRYRIGRVPYVTWHYRMHEHNMHRNIVRMERDVLYVFDKASKAGLFSSEAFRRKCYSSMYLILAASWAGDGRDYIRGLRFLIRAISSHPSSWKKLFQKIFRND